MDEKEIIKRLKNIIEINKSFLDCDIQENSNIYKDIQGLLDLYNKEKEKNKILEDLLQGNLYEMYNYYKNLCNSYQGNSISKDKIKEKIKYYIECRDCKFDYMSHMYLKYDAIVKVLKELLEEENK